MDFRDWFVVAMIVLIGVAATVFLFKHPEAVNFATWATIVGTLSTLYHFLVIKDSKQADAP